MIQENYSLKKELREAIARGLEAESLGKFLLPILANRKAALWKTLCNSSPDYQKIDNSYYFKLHLECKLLTDIESEISEAIARAEESSEKLAEIERHSITRPSASNLRM